MNKLILSLLMVVTPAYASLNDVEKAFIEHENILPNPSFLNGKAGWSVSTGSFSVAASGLDSSASWDAGAAAETFCSSLVAVPARLDRNNGYFRIMVQMSGASTHTVYVSDGTNPISAEVDVNISNGSFPVPTSGNFVFPATGSVQLCIESNSDEPSLGIFSAYVGDAANITSVLPQDVFSANANGATIEETSSDWLTSCVDNGAGIYDCTVNAGIFTSEPACACSAISGGGACAVQNATSTTFTIYRRNSSSAQADGPWRVICQKTGADAPIVAIKADSTNYPWRAFTPVFTGFGTIGANICEHKRQGQDMHIRCSATLGTRTAVEAQLALPDGRTVKSTLGSPENCGNIAWSGSTSIAPYIPLCTAGDAFLNFSFQGTAGLTPKVGNAIFTDTTTISMRATVPIEGWEESYNTPLVKGMVVSTLPAVTGIEYVNWNAAAAPVIQQQSGAFTSITNSGTGRKIANIAPGTFSDTPSCTCQPFNGSIIRVCQITAQSSTAISVTTWNQGGTYTDISTNIICVGPR